VHAQDDDGDNPDAPAEVGVRIVRRPLLHVQQFDLHVFGRVESVEETHARLDKVLNVQLRRLDRQYRLTDAQREKLFLAGQGDIKRALDRVGELRRKFELAQFDRNTLIQLLQEARRIGTQLDGAIFGVDSLFTKTVATTITDEQKAREDAVVRDSDLGPFQTAVADAAARLVPVLNLTAEQHRQLEQLLLNEIHQPRRSGESRYAYVMFQLSRLPEAKVRPIFRESQWIFLRELLMSWNQAGKFLAEDGFVFDESPANRRRLIIAPRAERRGQTGQ
jgi:hypothetical protein